MPTIVEIPPEFEKPLKCLRRKYPAVTSEVRRLVKLIKTDERPGDRIPHVEAMMYTKFGCRIHLPNGAKAVASASSITSNWRTM
jgi:hypothetical protein